MTKYIPNSLTILRVFAIPIFIFYAMTDKPLIALSIFVVASITDYLDGFIARKYNIITNFGKLMDPLADKILVIAALIILNIYKIDSVPLLHWIVTAIIMTREIAVTILRHIYKKKNIVIQADIFGKIKTITQMIATIAALTFYTAWHTFQFPFITQYTNIITKTIQIFFWLVAIVTLMSGVNYFVTTVPQMKKNER